MDGLEELTAAGRPQKIGGKTYYLMPLRSRDWCEATRYLNARRPTPIEIVRTKLDGIPEHLQRHAMELAFREERAGSTLTFYEVNRWFDMTPDGKVYRLWLMLRRAHPEVTLEDAERIADTALDEEAAEMRRSEQQDKGLPSGNGHGLSPEQTPETQANAARG